jgi:hypothetical protein
MKGLKVLVCLAIVGAFAAAPLWAQTTTGTILGDVSDATGAKLPGVTITVTNEETGASRETVTNELGAYRVSGLPPAPYTIKAQLAGFRTVERQNVRLPISSQISVPFTIEIASVAETITVTEQAPLIETSESMVKTLVDAKQIESLPLKSRDFLDLTLLSPGVVLDQGSAATGQTDSISFGGMSENYKSVWLEGVDFNDEVTGGGSALSSATRIALAQEAIQEFQVMANSYSAEFGRSASGAINIVTKSGGNAFKGSAFYFHRDDAFDKPNYFSETVPPFKIQQYGATLSGPIRHDKAFIFGSWERRANNRSVQVNIPVSIRDYVASLGYDTRTDVPVTTDENNYFFKGTWMAAQNHSMNVSYLYDRRMLFSQQTGGDSAGDHGYDDKRRGHSIVASLTSVLGSNTVNEFRFNRSNQQLYRELPQGTVSRPEMRFPTVQFGQASNVPQGRTQDNWIVTNATSHHFVMRGQHDLKYGFEANIVPTTSEINQSFNGLFEFLTDAPVVAGNASTLPFRFTQGIELRGKLAALNRDVSMYSGFINDTWQPLGGLTLSLGLRYDVQYWRGDLNGQDIPDNMSIEEFWIRHMTGDLFGQNFKPVPNDKNNWAPRLGLSWDPTGSGHTVVRAGWGYYYDQINTTTMRGVVAGYPGYITSQIANDSRSGARIPNDFFPNLPTRPLPESLGTAFRVASATAESPYTQQFTAGGTHQLGTSYAASFDYVYMRGESFPLTRNVNARRADGTFPLIASGLRLNLYDDSSPMRIHQAQFRIQKRFANRLGFLFGYTLGSAKAIADTGTPMDNYDLMLDWGPTNNDVRHRIVANALYELPFGIQLGSILSANSAPPFNITTGRDANLDGSNNDRPAGTGFNAGRGDKYFTMDLRASKRFPIRTAQIEILWEMFNVFNTVNLVNYNGNQSSLPGQTAIGRPTGFGQARTALDPFQGQLGVKVSF